MTPSEKYVADLCKRSFLPFWSFPNPLGKKKKELCDLLIVCDSILIIISVKDIRVSENDNNEVRYERWKKRAISDSVKQIHGAERYLKSKDYLLLKDRNTYIPLPPVYERQVFRIAIAFGGDMNFPLEMGNFENGFVHVFDEQSTGVILNELDTITDFISYLKAKEKFLKTKYLSARREIDFLAFYIQTGLNFESNPDSVILDDLLWEQYCESSEYMEWQEECQKSYVWDEMVSQLYKIHVEDTGNKERIAELEKATRLINLEPRINRIELGMILKDALNRKIKGRMLRPQPGSNYTYVFLPLSKENWNARESELQLRCLVARYENPTATKIIGIGIGPNPDGEPIFDLAYFDLPELSEKLIRRIKEVKSELGYFSNPEELHSKDMR